MTPEQIAASLTEAQRASILRTRGPDLDGLYWFALGSARGIPVELKQRTVVGHCLTDLGEQVRNILESSNDRHD